jgi:shikimate dehydrogenase
MKTAALLAHPAGHSGSPAMHNAAFKALGIDARYEAWDVPPDGLADALLRLREPSTLGANVSLPHKHAVLALVDAVQEDAATIGAANVLVKRGKRLEARNSDAVGFMRSLTEAGVAPRGAAAVVLGAGGAAHAVVHALNRAGARSVKIINRTPSKTAALTGRVGGQAASWEAVEARDVDVWVNATTVGMEGGAGEGESPIPAGILMAAPKHATVVDIVYAPRVTPLLESARSAGLNTVDGTGMLVHQGAVAFEWWTGKEAPVTVMRAALDGFLRGRA